MTKRLAIFLGISSLLVGSAIACQRAVSYNPPNGFVPDSATAVRIAEAVWVPIWGERKVSEEKPFEAVLNGEVWTVRGTLEQGSLGGVANAEIAKRDGRIMRVWHTQ